MNTWTVGVFVASNITIFRGLHSTEVAFALLTRWSWVRIWARPCLVRGPNPSSAHANDFANAVQQRPEPKYYKKDCHYLLNLSHLSNFFTVKVQKLCNFYFFSLSADKIRLRDFSTFPVNYLQIKFFFNWIKNLSWRLAWLALSLSFSLSLSLSHSKAHSRIHAHTHIHHTHTLSLLFSQCLFQCDILF